MIWIVINSLALPFWTLHVLVCEIDVIYISDDQFISLNALYSRVGLQIGIIRFNLGLLQLKQLSSIIILFMRMHVTMYVSCIYY